MEGGCVGSLIKSGDNIVKKKRSKIFRCPRTESNGCGTVSQKKEFDLNQCALTFSSPSGESTQSVSKKIRADDNVCRPSNAVNGSGGSKEYKFKDNVGLQSQKPDNCTDNADGPGNQNNIRKVKLKVGGVTRTIHTNSDGAFAGPMKHSRSHEETPEIEPTPKSVSGLQGVPWKDFSAGNFIIKECSEDKMRRNSASDNKVDKSDLVRKSRRVPKRRALDDAFEDEDDDEIRYLEKLRNLKGNADNWSKYEENEEGSKHQQKISRVSKRNVDHKDVEDAKVSPSSGRDAKKSRLDKVSKDADYKEEEEPVSDGLPDSRNEVHKDSGDSSVEGNKEMSLTRRQRALQSKDVSTNLMEFPDGLPPPPSRKNKGMPSEVEKQAKKAEAAQRRKLQLEKQAKESEAEAIRKILGQDSSRKKREDKLKKHREELAQEKATNAKTLPPNTVRVVLSSTGTVVTFSEDIGLPSIFNSKPCSYPAPREKCAGPLCTNTYIYRDSKSKVPLCSLKCYKAIHEQSNT
ncbi:hypothetical protein ACHQM5_026274 [Ranunculus cassubicifolius]